MSPPHGGFLSPPVIPVTLCPTVLHGVLCNMISSLSLCLPPLEGKTLGVGTLHSIHSVSPQEPDPHLAFLVEQVTVPTGHQVIYFSQDIV